VSDDAQNLGAGAGARLCGALLVVVSLASGCAAAPSGSDGGAPCAPGIDTPRSCTTCTVGDCCVQQCDPWGVWGTCVPRGLPCHDAGIGTVATCDDALASVRDASGRISCVRGICDTDIPCVDFGPCTECPFHLSCTSGHVRVISGGCPTGDSGVP
jgi:hypothetical protein